MSIQKFLHIIFFLVSIVFFKIYLLFAAGDVNYYYQKAKLQYENQMYNYAVENLEKALILQPSHFLSANLLAEIYRSKNKDKVKALHYYTLSLQANEAQPMIHTKVGELYYFFCEYQKAVEHLHKAIALNPDEVEAYYYLIIVFNTQKKYDEAFKYIAQCNEIKKKETIPLLLQTRQEIRMGHINTAIKNYEHVLQINPVNKDAYLGLASLYRQTKNIKEAIATLDKCEKIFVNDIEVLIPLAHLCFEYKPTKNRNLFIQKAIHLAKRVIAIAPNQCDAYSLLFEIYKTLGDVPLEEENASKYNACLENKHN